MIALLVPTRGRPKQYARMIDSVKATAGGIMVHAASNGDDDYVLNKYPLDCPTVLMWNDLAAKAMKTDARLFMLASDDIIFATPGWDKALIDHYNVLRNKIHVYHLKDSRDAGGTPHPIVTREYVEALGYFLPPIFLHWYVDTWTREIARASNCFTMVDDYLLIHDKPSDKGQADETHSRIRRMGWHQRDSHVNETCQHFLEFEKRRLMDKIKWMSQQQ